MATRATSQAVPQIIENLKPESLVVARLMTARQHIEQQKNGISVRGMVKCFMTTYDKRKSEQIPRATVLSAKNSRTSTEYAASNPTAKKTRFRLMMTQGCARPTFRRKASTAG
jgi:hypothetical protein